MKTTFLKGVALGSVISCSIVMGGAAFAGSGVGSVLNLGKYNGVNAPTALAGTSAGPQLHVTNTYGGTGATGIGITVHGGKPPLTVNSSTKVDNLNADQLDGLDSTAFQLRAVYPIFHTFSISSSHADDTFGSSGLDLSSSCPNGTDVGLGFANTGTNTGTINEMYSTGSNTNVVLENTVGAGGGNGFATAGSRLGGQFIWTTTTGAFPRVTHYVVTINIHEVNSGSGCVFTGTAELASLVSHF